jgi:hypothetical protein
MVAQGVGCLLKDRHRNPALVDEEPEVLQIAQAIEARFRPLPQQRLCRRANSP